MPYYDSALLKSNTENGRDWLAKVLHPPTEKGTSYNGYPGKSVIPVVHAEYRLPYEGLPKAAVQGSNTDTILFLHTPGVMYPTFIANRLDGDNPAFTQLLVNNQLDANTVVANFGKYRKAYQSVTEQYDATAFNKNGMRYTAQFSPTTYLLTLDAGLAILKKQKSKHLKGIAKAFCQDYPHLAEHIRSHIADEDDGYDVVTPRSVPLNVFAFQVVKLDRAVTTPADITMLSPKSSTSRSEEGGFVVHQMNSETNEFKSVRNYSYVGGATPGATAKLLLCLYEYTSDTAGLTTYLEPFQPIFPDNPLDRTYIYDLEWCDWTWCYSMYTGATPGASPLNINLKYIQGIEIAPITKSVLNSQTAPAALYDPLAIDSYTVITQSRQDSMPASYNSMGLSAIVNSVAPALLKPVADALVGKDNKPEVKQTMQQATKEQMTNNNETDDVVANEAPQREPPPRPIVSRIRNMPNTTMPMSARFSGYGSQRRPPRRKPGKNVNTQIQNLQRQIAKLSMAKNTRPRSTSRGARSSSRKRAPSANRRRSNSRRRM